MAVGDLAAAAGYGVLNGAIDLVADGDLEINRTRDYIATVKASVLSVWPISKGGTGATTAAGARTALWYFWSDFLRNGCALGRV